MTKKFPLIFTLLTASFAPAIAAGNSLQTANKSDVSTYVSQQSYEASGIVTDKAGLPIIGATVLVEGTTNGVSTDVNGRFTIKNVPSGAKIIATYIGCTPFGVVISQTMSDIKITLEQDGISMDEIVVVGYGTQRKESLTGALQTISDDKLKNITSPSVSNMLNGKAPGVFVSPGAGPGAEGKIIIRGKSTINGSTDPLWVVDGVIVGSSAGAVNPSDIASMTVLKDAASTAIYGSQGANGVILVTTKSAKSGKMTISASVKSGVSIVHNGNMDMMDGAQLYDYFKGFSNQESIKFTRWNKDLRNSNFDWWDLAVQPGITQDYNVSVSGGTEQIKSYFSVGVYDEKGAVKGYDYTRYNFRYKSDYKPYDWLTIKPMISGSVRDIEDQQYSTTAMYSNLPWDSPYDADGNIIGHKSQEWVNSTSTNYLYDLQWNKSNSTAREFMGNLDFDAKITDWLTFSSINNYKWQGANGKAYTDPQSNGGIGVQGRIDQTSSNMTRRYTNQILRFNKVFGDHAVSALAAYEYNDYNYESLQAIGTGFSPGSEILDVVALPEKVKGGRSQWAVQSMLLNANYSYKYKYLAQVSLRRDGASNFGDNAKYGNFFSASGAWNVHKEEFMSGATWINQLKVRASYGSVGNRPTSLYPQYDLYSLSSSYNGIPGALISQIGNKDLTWEQTLTTGIGVDFDMFNRLRITFDYYDKNTDNLLYQVPVSGVVGVTSIWRNVGELTNKGFELNVSGDIIKTPELIWTVGFNIATNKNKVKKLYSGQDEIIIGGGSNIAGSAQRLLSPGLDADTWLMPEWAGVDVETGAPTWYKTEKDGSRAVTKKYAEADLVTNFGSYTPNFFGGFSTDLSYKNIDFSAVFGYSVGGNIYNYSRSEYDSDGAYTDKNQMVLQDGWNRWEKPGDIATHPVTKYGNAASNGHKTSSRFLEDGSYLKLRSVTLGYNLAIPKWKIQNLRIFFSGENLFTVTDYSGVDPEIAPVENAVGGVVGPGIYPTIKRFMFGINITL